MELAQEYMRCAFYAWGVGSPCLMRQPKMSPCSPVMKFVESRISMDDEICSHIFDADEVKE